jgi:hypothetical protein
MTLKSRYVDYNSLHKKYLDNMASIVIMGVEIEHLRQKVLGKDKEVLFLRVVGWDETEEYFEL